MLLRFKDLMNVTENLQFKDPNRRMATPKFFSVTAENQLQLVALLMRGNQRLVLLLFPTSGCYRIYKENFKEPQG